MKTLLKVLVCLVIVAVALGGAYAQFSKPEHAIKYRKSVILNNACASLPKVGAQCGSSARWDLCGGRRVTGVPTAIIIFQKGKLISPGLPFSFL